MALFDFGKKKEEEKKAPTCIGSIRVLGAGCASCYALYENTREAVKAMDLSVEVEYITDMEKIMEYGVMRMPALVVNKKVVAMGKVLKAADISKLLESIS